MALSDELSSLEWLAPWTPLDAPQARACEQRVSRSTRPGHALHEISLIAIAARRDDPDEHGELLEDIEDVLFLTSSEDQLYVVNLPERAAAGKNAKTAADSPLFTAFASVEAFHDAYMLPDHLELSDEDV